MEIADNEIVFATYFNTYKQKFEELKELTEANLPRNLSLFDIRLRLALSLQIGFDNSISYTNTDTIRKIYRLILKLNDLWFAYEGLYKLCTENSYLKSNSTKSDPFTDQKIADLLLDDKVLNFGQYLHDNTYLNTMIKNDFVRYLQYLKDNSTGATQLRLLESFRLKANNNERPKFNEILSLIYSMRNMYVHNTDTAKSGVNIFNTKILSLKNCSDFLILISLSISIKIIEEYILTID